MLFFRIMLLLIFFTSCETEGEINREECAKSVLVDYHKFISTETTGFYIQKAEIIGDCLKISFNASGCSGSTWNMELIDSGVVIQSRPTKRLLKLSLENAEPCEALI